MTVTDVTTEAQITTGAVLAANVSASAVSIVNDAQRQLRSLNNAAWFDADGNYIPFVAATVVGNTLCVTDDYKAALTAFYISKTYRSEQENPGHQALADKYMAEFLTLARTL